MSTLLQINSSLFSDQGASSQLADDFVARWHEQHPKGKVIRRDLSLDPVPHWDGERMAAVTTDPALRTPAQRRLAAEADRYIQEIQAADVLVLGVPMYNYAVPTQLKAWFDHIARARVTFRYTEHGVEGLLKGKRAVVITTRGGRHRDRPEDAVVPFVQAMLNHVGITDVELVYAEGLNLGEAAREAGLREAQARIEQLLAA